MRQGGDEAMRSPSPQSPTVVLGVNWLGDTIMSLPALVALKNWMPREELHVVCPGPLTEVLRMAKVAHRVWSWPAGSSNWQRVLVLRRIGPKRAILFPNSFRSALVALLAGVPERWGYAGQLRGLMLNRRVPARRRPAGVHQSQHYLELLRAMGWHGDVPSPELRVPSEAKAWAREMIEEGGWARPLIGICPGATYGPAKRWPQERFVEAALRLRRLHGGTVVLTGSPEERKAVSTMASAIGDGCVNLAGDTDLARLAAVLSECQAVLCNDSGPMHLASALRVPVVAVFGSTDPMATHPLGPHRIMRAGLDCSPCLERLCPRGHYRCLTEVYVEDVVRATSDFLGSGG